MLRQNKIKNPKDYISAIEVFEQRLGPRSVMQPSGMISICNGHHFAHALTGSHNKLIPALALDANFGVPLRVAEDNPFAGCLIPIHSPYMENITHPANKYIHKQDAQIFLERYQQYFILERELNYNLDLKRSAS